MRVILCTMLCLCGGLLAAQVDTRLGGGGLFLESDDFSFRLRTIVQSRFTYHDTRAEGGRGGDNGRDLANFRVVRVRTDMGGHIFSDDLQYEVWLNWIGAGEIRVEDAFFRWMPQPWFNLTAGQMRVPASWEFLVGTVRNGMTHRSLTDEAFNQGWGKGVMVSGMMGLYQASFDHALLRWDVGIYNGVLASADGAQGRGEITDKGVRVTDAGATENLQGGFRNSDWRMRPDSFSQLTDGDLMFAGRVEIHPMGEIRRHTLDIESIEDTGAWFFMVGVAVNWFRARTDGFGTFLGNTYLGLPDTMPPPASGRKRVQVDMLHFTVDGHFRWVGFSLNWAFHYRRVDFKAKGSLNKLRPHKDRYSTSGGTDFGLVVDAGYFVLRDELAVVARFSYIDFDHFRSRDMATFEPVDGDAFGPDTYETALGLSWFIRGDGLKLTAEYRYVSQQLPHGNSRGGPTAGISRSPDWRNFQQLRLQLQWIF